MSNGILAYATYIPRYRLQHQEIATALGAGGGGGSRAIASYDEDTTTMGVEAARRAVRNGERPAALYFATTSPAYADKTNASAIHAALDLGHEGFALDIAGSARGAVGALRSAAASGGLAILSDQRSGKPGSADEREGGDGAAAFVFGAGDEVIAEVLGEASATAEFLDRWRRPGEQASGQWEERFGLEAYLPLIRDAAARALAEAGVQQADHVIVSSPHARAARTAAKELAGRVAEVAPAIGYTGAADPGIRLASALDRAAPAETVLLLIAADGCDACVLRTTDALAGTRTDRSVSEQASGGRDVQYATYLTWRGLLDRELPRRPEPARPAGPPSARSESWKFAFVGTACEECGQVHVPPRRVCVGCGATDRMVRTSMSGRAGRVATFTVDRLAYSPSPPMIDAVVDFEGGGRYTLEVADSGPEEVAIGTAVELTFRRLYTAGGVHNYFWKVRPA